MSESTPAMTTTASSRSEISLCFIGLPEADRATFERVISFCAAKGQHFKITADTTADILVTDDNDSAIGAAQQMQNNNTLLVVTANKDCTAGDFQLQRPLLVTRVMRTMENLGKQLDKHSSQQTNDSTSPALSEAPASPDSNQQPSSAHGSTAVTPASVSLAGAQSDANGEQARQTPGYLALIVDDSAPIRKQLEIELRTSGMRSEFAESGEQALEMIDAKAYDLIFLDIMMPGIDGYETCGKIRSKPSYKRTPVIMLSGKTSPLDEVQGVIAGASTYLTKPIKHDQFQQVTQRITRWLDEFRR